MRGLGQLVRARNIHTIGQLSAMTEYDINSLPIRSPKVATTRSALSAFAEQWNNKKEKNDKRMPQTTEDVDITEDTGVMNGIVSPDKEVLPSADDVLDVSPIKTLDFDSSMNSDQEEDPLTELRENNSAVDVAVEQGNTVLSSTSTVTTNLIEGSVKSPTRKKLLKDIKDIKLRMTPGMLARLASHQLVDLHQQLNEMMTSVVFALKSKCAASPQVSQSSQSDSD